MVYINYSKEKLPISLKGIFYHISLDNKIPAAV